MRALHYSDLVVLSRRQMREVLLIVLVFVVGTAGVTCAPKREVDVA